MKEKISGYCEVVEGYKLFKVRKDGSLGSLFIGARDKLPIGEWLQAETLPTKGFKVRHGWHGCANPVAPHLSTKGRAWFKVRFEQVTTHEVPQHQGSLWFTAERMMIVGPA